MDRRKKGCPNPTCEMFHKKHLFAMDNGYCPKCGTELVLVCKKCFKKMEDQGSAHVVCAQCEAKHDAKVAKAKNAGKKAGAVLAAAPAVIVGVVKFIKEDGKEVVDIVKDIIPK